MEPVVVMDTILVVRPREVQFKWSFDKVAGTVSNTGNTWFKLLIARMRFDRRGGGAWYLASGDVNVRQPALRQPGGTTIWSITTNLLQIRMIPVR